MSLGMLKTLPLVTHSKPDDIVAWCKAGPITLQQFLNDVAHLASQLLPSRYLLNVCSDRYHFSVGLAAAMTTGKVSLLPATYTPEMANQLKAYASDVFCLTDNETCMLELPQLQFPTTTKHIGTFEVPEINVDQHVVTVFTSGSTGAPLPHNKTWGALVQCAKTEANRIGLLDKHVTHTTIIGTVPPQHMYGFESTILMPWQSGHAISHAHPFYPADICQAIVDVPSPRILVSTPVHLRALIDAELAIPQLATVLSATAPLSSKLAEEAEAHCNAPLVEIYGSTETGQIASRRTTSTAKWQLFDQISLSEIDGHVYAEGGHIDATTKIYDNIEFISDTHFLLHGRLTDMINIAGKRHSLASLNYQLNNIPGVIDGAFYMPNEDDHTHITRLAAFVVSTPETDAQQILTTLRQHLDPVFIPRPLLFVDKLPRNSTGKLPRPVLQDLFNTKTNVRA